MGLAYHTEINSVLGCLLVHIGLGVMLLLVELVCDCILGCRSASAEGCIAVFGHVWVGCISRYS